MAAWLPVPDNDEIMRERTLWVFPSRHKHSWFSDAPCERVVLHFETVPQELELLLPPRGYYRVPLSEGDCTRLRVIAGEAAASLRRPMEFQDLYESTLSVAGACPLQCSRGPSPLVDFQSTERL